MRVLSELKKKPHSSAVLSMIKQQNQILASRQRQIKQGDILPDSRVCVCVCVGRAVILCTVFGPDPLPNLYWMPFHTKSGNLPFPLLTAVCSPEGECVQGRVYTTSLASCWTFRLLCWWFNRLVVFDYCHPMDCSPPGSSVHSSSCPLSNFLLQALTQQFVRTY